MFGMCLRRMLCLCRYSYIYYITSSQNLKILVTACYLVLRIAIDKLSALAKTTHAKYGVRRYAVRREIGQKARIVPIIAMSNATITATLSHS